MQHGKVIIFSAPSGSGKTTIVQTLLDQNLSLGFSISACTRDKRGRKEESGKDYYFLSQDDFSQKIIDDEFIEWEEVYPGNFYGTLKSEIDRIWESGKHVIFDVDVKGGLNLKRYFQEKALAIFVEVPSIEVLKDRLKDRDTESDKSLSQRLYKAEFEMKFKDQFDFILINDDLDKACSEAYQLVSNFISK